MKEKKSLYFFRYLIINIVLTIGVGAIILPMTLAKVPSNLKLLQIIAIIVLILVELMPDLLYGRLMTKRLSIARNGCQLLSVFLTSVVFVSIYLLVALLGDKRFISTDGNWIQWAKIIGIFVIIENILFWSGIIRIYAYSAQLGIKWRVIGIVCGLIPVVHLVVLSKLIYLVSSETFFENDKLLLDESRKDDKICQTKYPILLVHGVFFRDFKYLK